MEMHGKIHMQFLLEQLPGLCIKFWHTRSYSPCNDTTYETWFGTEKGVFLVISSDIYDVMYIRDMSFVKIFSKDDLISWVKNTPEECPNKQEDSRKHIMCGYCRYHHCHVRAQIRSKRICDQNWRNVPIGKEETFNISEFENIPNCMGIYTFIVESGRKGVGKSVTVRSRLQTQINTWKNIDPIKEIKILRVKNKYDLLKLERKMVDIVNPELNIYLKQRVIEIKGVDCHLLLDKSSRQRHISCGDFGECENCFKDDD